MPPPPNRKRSSVYIDAFNLYYGIIKGGPYKWLNLQRYFERLRPDDDIQVIRYFTAMISGRELPDQKTYLKALETLNPIRGAAVELRAAADRNRTLPLALLPLSQFPATIPDGSGGVLQKPAGW